MIFKLYFSFFLIKRVRWKQVTAGAWIMPKSPEWSSVKCKFVRLFCWKSLLRFWKECLIRNSMRILSNFFWTLVKITNADIFRILVAILKKLHIFIAIFITNHLEQFLGPVINTVTICAPEFKFKFLRLKS